MKSATFGLSGPFDFTQFLFHPGSRMFPAYILVGFHNCVYRRGQLQSRASYRSARGNGTPADHPMGTFPGDGWWDWGPLTDDGRRPIKYTEGAGDRAWMAQCDRNYLARLAREKQAAARKQAREGQLPKGLAARGKLKLEQPLKEEAEEQLKPLEAARSEAEAARLATLKAQQSQTPVTKVTLSEVSLAALQGNADAQFQLGQRYTVGLEVKRDKKEALQWFKKAAAQGHAPAQLALGRAYEKGEGTKKSLSTAQKWYAKAAAQQAPHAEKRLAHVKQRIAKRRRSSSHHSSTTLSTQSSTSHSSGRREQVSVGLPNRAGLDDSGGMQISLTIPSSAGTGGCSLDSPSGPPPPIPTAMLVAEVLYPFQGASAEELTLSAGERVRVVDQVTPDWWRCEHKGHAGLVPSQYLRTLSSAQVPRASPAGYTGYATPSSGEALGTAGIFTAATPNSATNQSGTPGASADYQMSSK
jgi:Variant SH3 domain/Sel1 repeat